jgi:CRISPR-associated endoribonuclease Cas6
MILEQNERAFKMRIGIPLSLYPREEKEIAILDISYQSKMLSLVKRGLSNYNPELFKKLYLSNTVKNFATSVYFPHAQFVEKKIILGDEQNAIVYFSTSDIKLGLNFFNAFQWLHQQSPFQFNKRLDVRVGKIFDVPLPVITSSQAIFKTMSPLVVRRQDGYFLSCVNNKMGEEYRRALVASVKVHLSSSNLSSLADTLQFEPCEMKKTVMNPFGQYVEASVGTFKLTGDPLLLNEILNSGLGGKRGSFAGMLGLVKEVNNNDI